METGHSRRAKGQLDRNLSCDHEWQGRPRREKPDGYAYQVRHVCKLWLRHQGKHVCRCGVQQPKPTAHGSCGTDRCIAKDVAHMLKKGR